MTQPSAHQPLQGITVVELGSSVAAPYTGWILNGTFEGKTDQEKIFSLKKVVRQAPSLGVKPPEGAIVLFDGTKESMKNWQGGRFDEKTGLLNTDGKDIRTAEKFLNYTMHVEFM